MIELHNHAAFKLSKWYKFTPGSSKMSSFGMNFSGTPLRLDRALRATFFEVAIVESEHKMYHTHRRFYTRAGTGIAQVKKNLHLIKKKCFVVYFVTITMVNNCFNKYIHLIYHNHLILHTRTQLRPHADL